MPFVHSLAIFGSNHPRIVKAKAYVKSDGLFALLRYYLAKGNAVILVVDDKATNGTVSDLQRQGEKVRSKLDFPEHYIESGRLVILQVSFLKLNAKQNFEPELYFQRFREVMEKTKRINRSRSIAIIGNSSLMRSKVFSRRLDKQLAFERHIANYKQDDLIDKLRLSEVVCCYNRRAIEKMPFEVLIKMINCHDSIIKGANPKEQTKLDADRIINCIAKGINQIMGPDSDKLVFRTLKVLYGISQREIVSNPELFESKLTKILASSSKVILNSIAIELRKEALLISDANFVHGT
jgi:hypothetical protein